MQNEPLEVTLKVTKVLERLGVSYLIGGSLASTLYGMVRTTQDSGIITEMRPEHIRPFVAALRDEFFIDEEMVAESIRRNSSFNIVHLTPRLEWISSFRARVRFSNLNLPALDDRPSLSKRKSAPTSPAPKIRSCRNWSGIAWAAKHQIVNGAMFSAC